MQTERVFVQLDSAADIPLPRRGTIEAVDQPPVVIDTGAVSNIASELLAVSDELDRLTRPLRLPVMNPASDPFTVRICTHINHTRAFLGATGSDAGEELTRMAEFLLSSAFNLHHIANWTTQVIRGVNAAPLVPRNLVITPRPHRAEPVEPPRPDWSISTDAEALACAALMRAGDQQVPELYYPDPRTLRALGERLRACSAQVKAAWPSAEPAAAKYQEFAQWISVSLAGACERSAQTAHRWATVYAEVRNALNARAESSATDQAASLDPYTAFDSTTELCADYPRLKV